MTKINGLGKTSKAFKSYSTTVSIRKLGGKSSIVSLRESRSVVEGWTDRHRKKVLKRMGKKMEYE